MRNIWVLWFGAAYIRGWTVILKAPHTSLSWVSYGLSIISYDQRISIVHCGSIPGVCRKVAVSAVVSVWYPAILAMLSWHWAVWDGWLLYACLDVDDLGQKNKSTINNINGLEQNCIISSALAMEILQSFTKLSICNQIIVNTRV